jgi:hypothetical protein
VDALGLIELQGARERVQDRLGYASEVAALKAGVILVADPSEDRYLLALEALDAAATAVLGDPGLGGREPRAAAHQELADVACACHGHHVTPYRLSEPRTASTRSDRSFRAATFRAEIGPTHQLERLLP